MEKTKVLTLLEKIIVEKNFTEEDVKQLINELVFHNPYVKIPYLPKAIEYKDLDDHDTPEGVIVAGQYNPYTKTLIFSNKFIDMILKEGLTLEMLCKLVTNIGHELTHADQFEAIDELTKNPLSTKKFSNELRDVIEERDAFRLTRNSADFVNQITKKLVGKWLGFAETDDDTMINDILMSGSYYNSALEIDARNGGEFFAKRILKAIGTEAQKTNSPISKPVLDAYSYNMPKLVGIIDSGVDYQMAFVTLFNTVKEIDINQLINLEEQSENGSADFGFNRANYLNFNKALTFCYNVKLHELKINELISHSKNAEHYNLPVYQKAVHDKIRRLIFSHQAENLPAAKLYVNSVLAESQKTKSPIINDSLAELVGSVADAKILCQYIYKTAPYSCNKGFNEIISGFMNSRLNVNLNDFMFAHNLLLLLKQGAENFKAKLTELLDKKSKQEIAKYIAKFYARNKNVLRLFDYESLNEKYQQQIDEIQCILFELEEILSGPVYAPAYNESKLNKFLNKK